MPGESPRLRRVAELIRRDLASLIRHEVDDPRMAMVSITDVEVSRDLAYGRVYVTFLGAAVQRAEVVELLNEASGFLRRELGRQLHLRTVPKLLFRYDEAVERGAALSALIDAAVSHDQRNTAPGDTAPADGEYPGDRQDTGSVSKGDE
ncbi:MAG: 30S ribosome-binding factor RbfA [Candidatus Competibacterales bacterium]